MGTKNNSYNFHLDRSVLLFFLIAILTATSLFAYRYSTREICQIVPFKMQAAEYRVGEFIRFTDQSIGAEKWVWNFNDSTDVNTERNPYHTYKKPGTYTVRLTVNDKCEIFKTVNIKEKRFVLDSSKIPFFDAEKSIMVGDLLSVENNTASAETWEWRFGETANVNSYEKTAKYSYKEPGVKTISLVVNGDLKHISKKKITVLPKPVKKRRVNKIDVRPTLDTGIKYEPVTAGNEEPKDKVEEVKKAPFISNRKFGDVLVKISKEEALPTELDAYMCGQLNMPVIVNKKKRDFLVFCQRIRDKKITVNNVELLRNKETGCITNIIIDLSKRIF